MRARVGFYFLLGEESTSEHMCVESGRHVTEGGTFWADGFKRFSIELWEIYIKLKSFAQIKLQEVCIEIILFSNVSSRYTNKLKSN